MKPAFAAAACLLTAGVCAAEAPAAASAQIAPRQEVAALLSAHPVRNRPDVRAKPLALVDATRPITGERTVLPVITSTVDRRGRAWLRVRLPGRSLGSAAPPQTGWISMWNTR